MVSSFGVSQSGPVRSSNEDYFLADNELSLFVVADGMGGHAAGEVASRTAVESIENFIRRSHDSEDFSWPCGIDSNLSFAANRVKTAIHLANRRVFRMSERNDDYTGMGTTVVCALITDGKLVIGHVGDSRLYLVSEGTVSAQTRDDTWAEAVQTTNGQGDDRRAVGSHPMRHVLTNVLGAREHAEIHVSERTVVPGEILLLCSDGVHNVLDDATLSRLLTVGVGVEDIARAVVAAAIDRGTRDNVTALVVRYESIDRG